MTSPGGWPGPAICPTAGLPAPDGDEATPTQEQIAKVLAAQKITQLRKMVEAETKRRTAEQLGPEHVQMYGIPQLSEDVEFLRASSEQLRQMHRVVAPLARTLATRLAARRHRARAGRSTCARPCASRCPPAACRSTWCCASPVRPAPSWWRSEVTHLFGPDVDLAVVIQRSTREAGADTRDGHSDYGNAFLSFTGNYPNVLSPRSSLLVLGDGRTNYRDPATGVLAPMVAASRHAHWLNPEPKPRWGSGDSAAPRYREVIAMHECRSGQLAAVIDQLLPI